MYYDKLDTKTYCPDWGVAVYMAPETLSRYAGNMISDEDVEMIVAEIRQNGKEVFEVPVPSVPGLMLTGYDWSTGLDFGHEYEGGGYILSFEDDYSDSSWHDFDTAMSVEIEWNDSYAVKAGKSDERSDEYECIRIGLRGINVVLTGGVPAV